MKTRPDFIRDNHFYLALLAGPLTWLVAWLVLRPDTQVLWPLLQPLALFWGVLFFPIFEEILFRGLIQDFVRNYFTDTRFGLLSVANIVTSLLFVLAHVLLKGFSPLTLLVFFPSLVFGYFRDRTGGLIAPILLHAWYNLGFLWLMSG